MHRTTDQPSAPSEGMEILAAIRAELRRPSLSAADRIQPRLDQVREMQRWFRIEPVGGRLTFLKKLVHWFSASTFDRQAKVIEALLEVVASTVRLADSADRRARALQYELERSGRIGVDEASSEPSRRSSNRLGQILGDWDDATVPAALALYSLVVGIRPEGVLAVGILDVEMLRAMAGALDDAGYGRLVCWGGVIPREGHREGEPVSRSVHLPDGERFLEFVAESPAAPYQLMVVDGGARNDLLEARLEATRPMRGDNAAIVTVEECRELGITSDWDAHAHGLIDAGIVAWAETARGDSGRGNRRGPVALRFLRASC